LPNCRWRFLAQYMLRMLVEERDIFSERFPRNMQKDSGLVDRKGQTSELYYNFFCFVVIIMI
jgi:hypothetical protein